MLDKSQHQTVGDQSTVIQSGNDVTFNMGLSYSEARSIAQDVARSTFYELAGEARSVMLERVENITDRIIKRISEEYPEGLNKAKDPDFQHALLVVQREYGRCGDEELGDLLSDLLVDRSKVESRSLKQIVLNESLSIAPKLTSPQISSLSIIFLLRHTINHTIRNHETLGIYLDNYIQPFIQNFCSQNHTYQHLIFTGCGSSQPILPKAERLFLDKYTGMFLRGLTNDEIESLPVEKELKDSMLIPCFNDQDKLQFGFGCMEHLEDYMREAGISEPHTESIKTRFTSTRLPEAEVKRIICTLRPYMSEFFEKWNNSNGATFNLTSVGIAISHASIKRIIPDFTGLSTWIN